MYLIFDTETTGIPRRHDAPLTDHDNWPRVVQLAWQLHTPDGKLLAAHSRIIRPEGFDIPFKAAQIHGITTARAMREGEPLQAALDAFDRNLQQADTLVGHNVGFDVHMVGAEYVRRALPVERLMGLRRIDTAVASIDHCALKGGPGGKFKMPRLGELYFKLFGAPFEGAHNAAYDVHATAKSFFALMKLGVLPSPPGVEAHTIAYEAPEKLPEAQPKEPDEPPPAPSPAAAKPPATPSALKVSFSHLHTHSQFSVLQATPPVGELARQAKQYGMPAVALTDLGNMYGAFKFVAEAQRYGVKPIVGCELFVAEERKRVKFTREDPDRRFRQLLLAKNKTGYFNLIKLVSLGFTEGLYGEYPRVDKGLIAQYREGLMASTGGMGGEVPKLILQVGERQAEEAFLWWKETFREDFYVEINRHGTSEEDHANAVLLRFCEKHGVRYFAANESYYLAKEDAQAHDTLLCIKNAEFISTPIGTGRGYRPGLPNSEFHFKTQGEIAALFHDLPKAIETTQEIVEKIESYELRQPVALPKYATPEGFLDENEYLRHITYKGAAQRYPAMTPEIRERIDFELETIKKTGYPGYFLITQDFTRKAREEGTFVGPGRGSAAGSVVAYCTGITSVDPIAYDLLFERFLNPDRISLPDIDIDFDDEGRDKALEYVIEKYGRDQVAQIITYGTMAAKSAIRDCARVLELSLPEANYMAKLVPEAPGVSLTKALAEVDELRVIKEGSDLRAKVLQRAAVLEGSLRNTSTHACGVIITPRPLTTLVPVAMAKGSDMLITQFDNSVVEHAGLLKMDFLGLTTLTIIKTALASIQKRRGIAIDIDQIPLDDPKTFQLYQNGNTTGTFQFESDGMQAYLKQLRPDKLEDLIAMNALYRPGPMEYIPNFIARKHGREPIHYDLPEMEAVLKDTYGITVYQEQVMLLSQQLAGFSKGDADVLRKAMGKKQREELLAMKGKFIAGCTACGHDRTIAEKIWKDWEAFAQYAFNKSHSTCYSLIAYQTAYLKANYPAEYMAAVLTPSRNNSDRVTFFIEECRKQKIDVLPPHINESGVFFEVNEKDQIRFGLGAIKGMGEAAARAIVSERETRGEFETLLDFVARVSQQIITKKNLECLALSGALDSFSSFHRRQFFVAPKNGVSLTEKLIRYAAKTKQDALSQQGSLFGSTASVEPQPAALSVDMVEPFDEIEKLHLEKETIGIYASGHPLDSFKLELNAFSNAKLADLAHPLDEAAKKIRVGGIVAAAEHRMTRHRKPFGKLLLEDYSGKFEFVLWSEDYLKFKPFLAPGLFLFVEGSFIKRAWREAEPEFKIQHIELLNELSVKRTRKLKLKLSSAAVDESTIAQLEKVCRQFSGECPLYLNICDEHSNIHLELLSRKYKLRPDGEAIKALAQIAEVDVGG